MEGVCKTRGWGWGGRGTAVGWTAVEGGRGRPWTAVGSAPVFLSFSRRSARQGLFFVARDAFPKIQL